MRSSWIECPLAHACSSIDYGLTASASHSEVGPKFLRITDIVQGRVDWGGVPHVVADAATEKKYRLDDGDIVIARTGASTGASAYIINPPPAVFASYLVRIKAQRNFDARFIAYYLKSTGFWNFIRGVLGDKSAQPNASASTMASAPFRAPRSKGEQHAIANILAAFDDRIDLCISATETAEAIARTIYRSWFIDFDPVRSDAVSRGPGLPEQFAALFPSRLEHLDPEPIPRGWRRIPFSAVASNIREQENPLAFASSIFDHYSIPAFDVGQVPHRVRGAAIKSPKSKVPAGTVLLSKLNPEIERIWLVDVREGERAVCSTEFLVLQAKPPFTRSFVYCLTRSQSFRQGIASLVTGTSKSHQRAQVDSILRLPAMHPGAALLNAFEHVVEPILARSLECRRTIRTLAALRDTLLPKLISGELRIRDAERFVADVA